MKVMKALFLIAIRLIKERLITIDFTFLDGYKKVRTGKFCIILDTY